MRLIGLPAIALPVLALTVLAACVADDGPREPYLFVGSWDCGVEVIRFTNTTYDNGKTVRQMRTVTQDGRNFKLYFDKGYKIALGAVTETGLTWVSGATGDQFNCRRVM